MSSSSDVSSDSSDDEMKRDSKGSSDSSGSDSDNKTNKKKRASRGKNKAIIESAGSSDSDSDNSDKSDDSESDDEKPVTSRKRKAETTKRVPVHKRKLNESEDEKPKMDKDLFADEEDYDRVMKMSEKEREQEIFNRMEQLEFKKTREQIEQKLAAAKGGDKDKIKERRKKEEKRRKIKSSDEDSDGSPARPPKKVAAGGDSDEDMEYHRPSEVDKKKKQKDAIADLLKLRKEKEKKNAKKTALEVDKVFGKDSDSDSSSSSSSQSSSSSSKSSSRSSSPERADSDDEDKKISKKEVDDIRELMRARLSRFKLANIVHSHFFKNTVIGSYVRIGDSHQGKSRYYVGHVVGVEEGNKVYNLEKTRTNKVLRCKLGKAERTYRLEFVSNAEFTLDEFQEWYHYHRKNNSLPTMDTIEKKEADIKKAMSYKYSNNDIDQMVREKARFATAPRNYAMQKGELTKKKEAAEQEGDHALAKKLQEEIDSLERQADSIEKTRTADISSISYINQRNRNKMKEQFLGDNVQVDISLADDPFTRKKERMKVSSGTKGSASQSNEQAAGGSTSYLPNTAPTVVKPATPVVTPKAIAQKSNLFDLHKNMPKFELDIDLGRIGSSSSLSSLRRDDSNDKAATPSPTASKAGKGMSLEDYRRRKAAMAQNQ